MPTYEYACTECGHTFEQVQSFYDDALTHCPQCDGRLRKVFNAVGVVFKGAGFYHTDSRAAGSSGATAAKTTAEGGSGEKAAAPSGTKSGSGSGSGSSGGDSSNSSKATTSSAG